MTYDVIIIGGGLAGTTAGLALVKAGKKCCIVSEGLSLHDTPKAEYLSAGGDFFAGDSVVSGEWDGRRLKAVFTRNLESTRLEADTFILATGKFFSKGLVADMEKIFEPVFHSDVDYEKCRDDWYDPDFFAKQPFERFGVKTEGCKVIINGETSENLYAAGEILSGEIDIVKTAEEVCRRLI